MPLPKAVLQQLHWDLSGDLDRIGKRFATQPKITLIIRNPDKGNADVVLRNDTLEAAFAAARQLEAAPIQCVDGDLTVTVTETVL